MDMNLSKLQEIVEVWGAWSVIVRGVTKETWHSSWTRTTYLVNNTVIVSVNSDFQPYAAAKSLQSCPTLCNPMDCSPPGSSIHGIFQARVLKRGAIAFSVLAVYIYPFSSKPSSHPLCHITLSRGSLCYTVGTCWLPILNIVVSTWPSQTP